ncbi:MAG: hypothetical protein HYX75_24660 [Acidobacteria bacterium]|nr:hypothetical protein [Acidobacteriota bacterium]
MARVGPEHFEGHELVPVFLAASLNEATAVERILTDEGVDYVIGIEEFVSGILTSPASGAVFYVAEERARYCRERFSHAGLDRGVISDE